MKTAKIIVSFILCAVMVLSMVGCVGVNPDKAKLVGTWTSDKIDLTESVAEEFAKSLEDEQVQYFHFSDYGFKAVFTFNEDDTYSLDIDEASIKESMNGLKDSLYNGFVDYFNAVAEENNLTMDQMLEILEVSSLDELLADSLSDEAIEKAVADTIEGVKQSGKYAFDGGYLYLLTEEGDAYTDKFTYTFNEDGSLTIDQAEDSEDDEYDMFPLNLYK